MPALGSPASPGQWSQSTLAPYDQRSEFLAAPPRVLGDEHRRGSFSSDVSETIDYFSARGDRSFDTRSSPGTPQSAQNTGKGFDSFLTRTNRQIAKEQRHVGDPFRDSAHAAPNKPFGQHSRILSVESIASVVDEKSDSPLNKALQLHQYVPFGLTLSLLPTDSSL